MELHTASPLLAGLTPAQFMRRHWQKKPLLVRAAISSWHDFATLSRAELFKLAATEGVESRLITKTPQSWRMKNGPFAARSLPPISKPDWTLLVQSVDALDTRVHALLQQFRFVPDARLDDVMISYATPGGGVGPHFDSYDVFLLQASGSRLWKISRQKDLTLQNDKPLKILQNFEPEEMFVLHAGDMLYLPPRYAHEGVAQAALDGHGKVLDCITYSIGFKSPASQELAAELLHRVAEFSEDAAQASVIEAPHNRYRDPQQSATLNPALLPEALVQFARDAVTRALADPLAIACALGEIMTTPKQGAWFDELPEDALISQQHGLTLDAKTRMLYDTHHLFINGESYRAKGRDAALMQQLADRRCLLPHELAKASSGALELLADWYSAGWITQSEGTP